jgi:curved DNA-binding protein CbpA
MANKMSGIFSWTKKKQNREENQTIICASTKQENKKNDPIILDPSRSLFIDVPELEIPSQEDNQKPHEYWDIYNNGISFYKRKWYEKAKNEFIKLLIYDNPHRALFTHLLITYRKLIAKNINDQELQKACLIYKEFFEISAQHITDTDRRNYNKLIDNLIDKKIEIEANKLELAKKAPEPDFIINSNQNLIFFIKETKIEKDHFPKKISWKFVEKIKSGTIYIKPIYDKDKSIFDKSAVYLRDNAGKISRDFIINQAVTRLKACAELDMFVISSNEMIYLLYSIQEGCIKSLDLRPYSKDKNHIRCVDFSSDRNYFLFTHIDKAYLMDSAFNIISIFSCPLKTGWEKGISPINTGAESRQSKEHSKYLSILGLDTFPSNEEIKTSFRNMLKKYHPDINPDPSSSAKTIEIITAYEKLTGEEAKNAFENPDYYYTLLNKVRIQFPQLSISVTIESRLIGPGEDWIYATHVTAYAERIYLGCYSGIAYCISKSGEVKKSYRCLDPIRSIHERGNYVYFETDFFLLIIKDDKYLAHIRVPKEAELKWYAEGFMLINEKEIQLYTNEGSDIGKINFTNKINDIYWTDDLVNVASTHKIYAFSISKQIH